MLTDRIFKYDGRLWEAGTLEARDRDAPLRDQVKKLTGTLANALEAERRSTASPVFELLPGLKPLDWTGIKTARTRFFDDFQEDWLVKLRTAVERARPGNLLMLAMGAHSIHQQKELLLAAGKGLISLHRFDLAKQVFDRVLELDPDHFEAKCQRGIAFNRLAPGVGRAEVERLVEKHKGEPEAQGLLGRVYKDLWRAAWEKHGNGPQDASEERVATAGECAETAVSSAGSYYRAFQRCLNDHYTGVNALALARLLEHLNVEMDDNPLSNSGTLDCIAKATRLAADNEWSIAKESGRGQDSIWAAASLGELGLLEKNSNEALKWYTRAIGHQDVTTFQLRSMGSQLDIYAAFDFEPETVSALQMGIQAALDRIPEAQGTQWRRVFIASGHRIDPPGRKEPRFPKEKAEAVRGEIATQLDKWEAGPGDLCLCGGANGADILFGEECVRRGVAVRLMLAMKEDEYLRESVRLEGDDGRWVAAYMALRKTAGDPWVQPDEIGGPPAVLDPPVPNVFAWNNIWMLKTALVEAPSPDCIRVLLVWGEKVTGDGPGGTSDFEKKAKALTSASPIIINPTTL